MPPIVAGKPEWFSKTAPRTLRSASLVNVIGDINAEVTVSGRNIYVGRVGRGRSKNRGLARQLSTLSPLSKSVSRLLGGDAPKAFGLLFEIFVLDAWKQCRKRRFRHREPSAAVADAMAEAILKGIVQEETAAKAADPAFKKSISAAEKYSKGAGSLYLVAREVATSLYRRGVRCLIPQVAVHDAEIRRAAHPQRKLPRSCNVTAIDFVGVTSDGDVICAETKLTGLGTYAYSAVEYDQFWRDGGPNNTPAAPKTPHVLQTVGATQLFLNRLEELSGGMHTTAAPILFTALLSQDVKPDGTFDNIKCVLREEVLKMDDYPYTISLRATNALRP